MRILRNYILREFFDSFILSIVVFTFVLLVGNVIKLADLVINKGVDAFSVFRLFLYLIPWLLSFTLPIASLTAVILLFGRLSSDGELTAMKASGVSLYRISFPILLVGALFSSASYLVNDQISPNASFATRKAIKEIGMKSPSAYLEEGTFIRGFENYIIFIYEIRGNKFKNIRVYQPQEGRPTRTVIAEYGEIDTYPERNEVRLALHNGTSEEPSPTDPETFYKLNFKTYFITLDLSKIMKREKVEKKTREMTLQELTREIAKAAREKIDATPLFVEVYKKINMSLAPFALILLGIPLGIRSHRSEKSIGFGVSLLLFAVYWGVFLGGVALSLQGTVDPAIGVSLGNIIFLITGMVIYIYTARR